MTPELIQQRSFLRRCGGEHGAVTDGHDFTRFGGSQNHVIDERTGNQFRPDNPARVRTLKMVD